MISRALDAKNDIFLNRNRIAVVSDGAEVVQHVRSRLLFYLGECTWDTTAGVPYFQRIFVKPLNLPQVEAILKAVIIQSPNVAKLLDFSMAYTSSTRQLVVAFEAETTYGVVFGATVNTIKGVSI
ncbi:hypothetical protein D9M71_732850 [compost metagenome]